MFFRYKIRIMLIAAISLLCIYFVLPFLLVKAVEYKVNQDPNYTLNIESAKVSLFGPSLKISNLILLNHSTPSFEIKIQTINLQLVWQHGLVPCIDIQTPSIYFNQSKEIKNSSDKTTSITTLWQNFSDSLPTRFVFTLHDGQLTYHNEISLPDYSFELTQINMEYYPSQRDWRTIKINAQFQNAPLTLTLAFKPKENYPTFKLEAKLEKLNLANLNDFLQHYTDLTVNQGKFSLFIEAAAKDAYVKGYAKPFVESLDVSLPQGTSYRPIKQIYRASVEGMTSLLSNEKDELATKIPLSGHIDEPDTNLWDSVLNLLYHAFINSLKPGIDHTIKLKNIKLEA